jgi:hypothetical protein
MITLPENLVYIVIWEYEQSNGLSSGVSAVFTNKDAAENYAKETRSYKDHDIKYSVVRFVVHTSG